MNIEHTLITDFYDNNQIKLKQWYLVNNNPNFFEYSLHHSDEPALTFYNEDGTLKTQKWYNNGILDRKGELPSIITYFSNGNVKKEKFYKMGVVDRDGDEPSVINYFLDGRIKTQKWIKNNIFNRGDDKPSWITYNENGKKNIEQWFFNNNIFRFGLNEDFKPKPSIIIYNDNGEVEHIFYRIYHNLLSPEKYLEIAYLFRRKILNFKKKKRKEMVEILKIEAKYLYFKNGPDILNLISKYLY